MAMRQSCSRWCVALLVTGLVLGAVVCPAAGKKTGRQQWQQPARVVADLGLKSGMRIADIGCGRGFFTFHLAKAVGKEGKVYATEISKKAIKSVADRVKRDKLTNIEPVISEPTKTKLVSESVDTALISMVLHHVPKNLRAALTKDIVRAIRPGGYLFILDWRVDADIKHDKDRRIPRDGLIKFATDAGLTLDAEFHYLKNQVFLRLRKPTKPK